MSMLVTFIALAHLSQAPTGTLEVPFRLGDSALIVDAKVNNRPVSLMFDTGFGGFVLLNSSIDVGPADGKMTLRDFVGQLEVDTVKMKSLYLGAKKIDTQDESIVQDRSDYTSSYGQHVDGIMGFSVIKDNITEINFEKKKFVFYPKTLDISKRVPDNKKTFLLKMLPIGHNSIELPVKTPSGKNMTLALDTGNAFFATTHKDVLERVELWEPNKAAKFTRVSGVASGNVDSWSLKMPPLTIFGVPVKSTVWDIIDLPSSSAEGDGTVGFGFLKNFNITIDYARRRVWLENWNTPIENEEKGDLGISAGYDRSRKRVVVFLVAPDSPASVAGIKEGDELLSMDGNDFERVGFRRIRQLLEGPIGSKVKLAVSRNGTLKRFEIERKPLYNEK